MPTTQAVEAEVEIGDGIQFIPTSIDTRVRGSSIANSALIKGKIEDVDSLERNLEVTVTLNGDVVFSGLLKFAAENFEGLVELECHDTFYDLHNKGVTLQTEKPRFLNEIARDLLSDFSKAEYGEDRVIGRFEDPDEADRGSIYVAPGREFVGDRESRTTHKSWGSADSSKPLVGALEEIADGLAGVLWTDRRNVLRLEPIPTRQELEAGDIIDANGGSDINNTDSVKQYEVGSGNAAVGSSSVLKYFFVPDMAVGLAINGAIAEVEDITEKKYRLDDHNIVTKGELDRRAAAELIGDVLQKSDHGTLTVAGSTDPDPWDVIDVPVIDNLELMAGKHAAAEVNNVVNSQDGWQTEISLVPEIGDVVDGASGSGGIFRKLADIFTASITTVQPLSLTQP